MPDDRKPLVKRAQTAEEAKLRTPDNFPRTDNPLELEAQRRIEGEPMSTAPVFPTTPPLIGKKLLALAVLALPTIYIGAGFLPPPYGPIAIGLLYVVGVLLGVALPTPKVLAGKAVIGTVPALGSATVLLAQYAATLPEGKLKGVLFGLSVVLSVLTGVALPTPKAGDAVKALLVLLIVGTVAAPTFALADDILGTTSGANSGTIVSAGSSTTNSSTATPFTPTVGNTYCAQATGGAGYVCTLANGTDTCTSAIGYFVPQDTFPCYPIKVFQDRPFIGWVPVSGAANLKVFNSRW